jgi:hypothetical protein
MQLGPTQTTAVWSLPSPIRLEPWHWYRLSFDGRIEPGAKLTAYWSETDTDGHVHHRHRRLDRGPTDGFEKLHMEFISRPAATAFTLTLRAEAVRDFQQPTAVEIRNLRLSPVRPADASPTRVLPHAIYNGDFETPAIAGFRNAFHDSTVEIVTAGDAPSGRRYLRHEPGPDGEGGSHWYCPVLDDVALEHGGMYRISLMVRGAETPWVLIAHGGNRRLNQTDPKGKGIDPDAWRRVFRDVIVDGPTIRNWKLALFIGGRVDIDDIRLERVR